MARSDRPYPGLSIRYVDHAGRSWPAVIWAAAPKRSWWVTAAGRFLRVRKSRGAWVLDETPIT